MTEVDYVEVSRKAYELSYAHGRNARAYAAKLAAAALAEGQIEEHHFWKAVEAALTPRGSAPKTQTETPPASPHA
jgi:hypothetical protein